MRDRFLLLVACQATIAILLTVTIVRTESKALSDHNRVHWIVGIAMAVTAVTSFIGINLTLAASSRMQNLVSYVRRFQDSGKIERIGDRGDDNISVLANAIDAGFAAMATRERDREQFMAIAAHELKTPVTTIQGFASFLATHPLSSDSARALEIINHQSWRLSRLIEALLLAVRAKTGNLRFEPRPLNMSVLVRRVLQEMEPFLSRKAFTSQISENVSILGDEALLEHALWCLFTCAAALSPESVPVKVTLAKNHRASLSVDIEPRDYPMAAVEELFLPFRSVQYETADGLRSPIGLYFCREIVRVHNGRLYVHDVSAFNPEFLMELPI